MHSLWLKASQETSQQNKISAYDTILDLRPDDVEALSYKADAVLEMQEPLWAISLCQRALKLAPENGHAHYQLACAYAEIGRWDDAVTTLQKAINISEAYKDDASVDPSFEQLRDHDSFRKLIFPDDGSSLTSDTTGRHALCSPMIGKTTVGVPSHSLALPALTRRQVWCLFTSLRP